MRVDGTPTVAAAPGLRRWTALTVALAATLLALAGGAAAGSWRQARIADAMAADSTRTDDLQQAGYLAALEMGLLQGILRDPHGRERTELVETGTALLGVVSRMAARHDELTELAHRIARQRRAMQPVIAEYVTLIEHSLTGEAQVVLEERIEPSHTLIRAELAAQQQEHVAAYAAGLARAKRDSRMLALGTVSILVLGLVVLGLLGWSGRSHRRVIERMAAHDSLTGLPNRVSFHVRAEAALAGMRGGAPAPTVLALDLDGFKDVNDNLGHHVGDLLLVQVAQRLRESVRTQDTVARLGGDEFAVLFADSDPGLGEFAADRIMRALGNPFVVDGIVLDIEVSIGITTAAPDQDVTAVMRQADTAMYAAKEHRLGHTRFDPAQATETAARLTILGDLRRALDNDAEISLHYQPKIAMDTMEIIGAEALARWQHPTKGPISPGEFIPVLEGTSLVRRFTERVLAMALAQVREWLDAGHRVPVAVNVSTRCLLDVTFADTVAQALRHAGVPGELLCIEVTENTVMADPHRAMETLRRIRALDVRTAIDDFGTGYSSMAYLKVLPVDEIKVDRSFVRDMATDRSNYVLVESAVDLGHNLGLAVVAEGVEDEPVVAALQRLGCDVAQGYHFARPLPPAEFTGFLIDHPNPAVSSTVAPVANVPGVTAPRSSVS